MACSPIGKNERRVNQFNKIRLWCSMADGLAKYGVSLGNEKLFDYIDMNCGDVPQGEFEQVIDLSSPHQFLAMYTQIAEDRFAFAVTELLKMNTGLESIKKFCFDAAKNQISALQMKIDSALDAFELYKAFVLDGMPCDETKNVTCETQDKVEWQKLLDTHEKSWAKAGGNLSVYYELQKSFVLGLFSACENAKFSFEIKDDSVFTINKC